ncbi:MAG: L,D-transpeptidase family protein [Alphaproteobacteria bacterium]|nr:L,D-transpeptidase family protein [Alphaproteobacteria bacterium]
MVRLLIFIAALLMAAPAGAEDSLNAQKYLADPSHLADFSAAEKNELRDFYIRRGDHAAWNLSDADAEKKILAFLDSVEALVTYHGLIKSPYALAEMRKLAQSDREADQQRLEFLVTASLLRLAHDLHGDTVNLADFYPGWILHRRRADIPTLLATAVREQKLEAFFAALAPQNASYRQLAQILHDYRALAEKGGWQGIGGGPSLQPGMTDARVPLLRARLAAEGYNPPAPTQATDFFDDDLAKTLIAYQTRNGLEPDGHAGALTQEALNTSIAARIAQIRANMERWRHMPETFPPARYAMVNIPDYSLTITEGGETAYNGIVVLGRVSRKTPFIASKIVNMVVNPSWHVPTSIARKDILPKLREDPHYLEDQGIVIAGRTEDPSGVTIDWQDMQPEDFNFQLRQNPGDLNSLGQLKFNFDNAFAVYMHGTPHQELFDKAQRDFSSGCVRLAEPAQVGEVLLASNKFDDGDAWDEQHIMDSIAAGKTRWVTLANPMPLYFLYWTVFADAEGNANFRKDIYGYDGLLMRQLKDAPAP